MRTNALFCLIINLFFVATATFAQTINFDETWKEFLENNKISNMSELVKPNKVYEQADYAKYLLMNTNTDFCQSDVDNAGKLMAEVQAIDPEVHKAIPGFVKKMEELDAKIKAYHSMDAIWKRFLQTKEVTLEEIDAIAAAKTSCEKKTLAKYSFMTAYKHFCQGNVPRAKDIFENRTLQLTEKTTLRIDQVEGLAAEVATMKALFRDLAKLDLAWKKYVDTGVSPGFDIELPLFSCNPIPNMKALILNGALDLCNAAPAALEKVKQLQAESGVAPNAELAKKMKELEVAVKEKNGNLTVLNEAWEAFLPDNKVKHLGKYGYEYCSKEAVIRAYIMDGFAYTCDLADEMLDKIDALQKVDPAPLDKITITKINELSALIDKYAANGVKIEKLWNKFVAQGDKLTEDYQSTELYCDNIHQVKDWTMKGFAASCEEGIQYLEQIEAFQKDFEFKFTKDVECRVQKLRIKVWDCRYQALQQLARVEAPNAYDNRLKELMKEYGMEERPAACLNK
ncbi:MAG: hypothetical protein ACK4TA_17285 [Saprospiraceae bacterium]